MHEVTHTNDSFEELKHMCDGFCDVVITDPPYSSHVHSNMTSGTAAKGRKSIPCIDLPFAALSQYTFAHDLVRVSKRWAIAFCAVEDFGSYRSVNPDHWVRGGIWYKPNSMGQLTGDRPAAAYEGLAIMHRKQKKQWNGRGSYAYWSADSDEFPDEFPSEEAHYVCNGTRGEKLRHPNQKPLKLCLELVAKFSNRGETVLDPFAGSGRIGEACMMLGREYIGWDCNPEWVDKANARLKSTTARVSDEECLRLCREVKAK